ncbi:MAG: response regulator transcription factor [Bacillota bacterium]
MNPIKVLIVDDQSILTQGLKMILDAEHDLRVVGLASNGQEALSLCQWQCPDVILMDIKMPVMNGVTATEEIIQQFPYVKIIILTTFQEEEYIFNALKKGACGYLLKESPPEEIINAIRTVVSGGSILQPSIAAKVVEEFSRLAAQSNRQSIDERINYLSDREIEIAKLVGLGKNNKEIASELFLTEGTVRNHLTHILEKLSLRDRTQLAIFIIRNHLI